MNLYQLLGSRIGTAGAIALSARLAAWHDVMVTHERRVRAGRTSAECDDDCPHGEARALWTEAVTTFGARAHELRTVLMALAVGIGGVWLTRNLSSAGWLAISLGLAVWALVRYFGWRARFLGRILGDAENDRRTA